MNFFSLIAQLWPLAIGAAISPSITVICFALLQGPNGRRRVFAFWVGAASALLVWAILVSSFMWRFVQSLGGELEDATHILSRYERLLDLVLGSLLIAIGILRLLRRPTTKKKVHNRFSISDLKDGPLRRQVTFGAIVQGRNVTSILMFIAAQQSIVASEIADWQKVATTLIVIGVATSSIWLVLVTPQHWTDKTGGWLSPIKDWMQHNARYVEVAAAFGIGTYLIIRSLTGSI